MTKGSYFAQSERIIGALSEYLGILSVVGTALAIQGNSSEGGRNLLSLASGAVLYTIGRYVSAAGARTERLSELSILEENLRNPVEVSRATPERGESPTTENH